MTMHSIANGFARRAVLDAPHRPCPPRRCRIAAVVVTHNRPALLAQVIAALHAQSRRCEEIFIVDNASGASTQELLGKMRDVTVLRSDVNLGGTGGFTVGMQRACGGGFDWIWLLDDDAIPRIDALESLERVRVGLPRDTGAVCGTVREFGAVATMHRRRFSPLLGLERSIGAKTYADDVVAIDTGSFVGFMVATAAIAKIGLPDPAFFLAYDDTEYSLRLKRAGFSIWLIPGSVVEHLRAPHGRMRATVFGPKHYFNVRNRIVVKMRYAGLSRLSGVTACLFGFGLWLRSGGRQRGTTLRILWQALQDGWRARLGPYPHGLESSQVRVPLPNAAGP